MDHLKSLEQILSQGNIFPEGKKKKKCSTVRLFTDLSVPSYVLRYAIQQKSINKNSCQQMAQSMLPLVT